MPTINNIIQFDSYIILLLRLALIIISIQVSRLIYTSIWIRILNKKIKKTIDETKQPKERAKKINQEINQKNRFKFFNIPKSIKTSWSNFYYEIHQSNDYFIPDVYDYFKEHYILDKIGWRKFFHIIPSIFVSLGILGTFIGIADGMSDINSQAPIDELQRDIDALLSAMTFAFSSSIVGIFLSLIFQVFNHTIFIKYLSDSFHSLILHLDQAFPIKDEASLIEEMYDRQHQQMNEFQTFLGDSFLHKFTEDLSKTFESSLTPYFKQTQASIQNLSNNLVHISRNQEEQYESFVQFLTDDYSSILTNRLTHSLENSLKPHLDESNKILDQVAQNVMEAQNKSLDEMVNHFVHTFNKMTGEHIEKLQHSITETVNWQEKVHISMSHLVNEMSETADSQNEMAKTTQALNENLSDKTESLIDYQKELSDSAEKLSTASKENSMLLDQISRLTEIINVNQEESEDLFDKRINEMNNAIHSMTDLSQTMQMLQTDSVHWQEQNHKNIDNLVEKLSLSANNQTELAQSTYDLNQHLMNHIQGLFDYQDSLSTSTEKLTIASKENSNLLDKLSEFASTINNNFEKSENTINERFKNMTDTFEKMNQLSDTMKSLHEESIESVQSFKTVNASVNKTIALNTELSESLASYQKKVAEREEKTNEMIDKIVDHADINEKNYAHMESILNKLIHEQHLLNSSKDQQANIIETNTEKLLTFWSENKEALINSTFAV